MVAPREEVCTCAYGVEFRLIRCELSTSIKVKVRQGQLSSSSVCLPNCLPKLENVPLKR